jgi:DNA-binding LacI/PurR family transcriptional regulator
MEAHDVIRVAAAAQIHPDTVKRYLRGGSVRGLSRVRIESAMRWLGLRVEQAPARGPETAIAAR